MTKTQEITVLSEVTQGLQDFNNLKEEFTTQAEIAKKLTINGIEDKDGFKLVHEMQMKLQKKRTGLSKDRKGITSGLDTIKKQLMDGEKELLEIIQPVEQELKEKKEEINLLKLIEKNKEALPGRIEKLKAIECEMEIPEDVLLTIDDEEFTRRFNVFNGLYLENKARELKEKEDKIKAEEEARQAEIQQQKDIEEAKKQAIEDERLRIENEKEEIRLKAEREKADIEKKHKEELEAIEAKAQAEKEKEALNKRLAEEKAQEEKEKLEANTKFQEFKTSIGITEETKNYFKEVEKDGVIYFYKFVGKYEGNQ